MSLPEYTASTYTVELLANQYKKTDIQIKEAELVTDQEVCSFLNKTMPVIYLLFFLFVVILSGVLVD